MTADPKDIWQLLDAIDHHHRSALAKTTELRALISSLNLKPAAQHRCPTCNLDLRSQHALAEHRYVSHDGPTPTHWTEAEQRTEEAA